MCSRCLQLVNLPALVEIQKTTDRKYLFKVGDLHQMIVCQEVSPDAGAAGDTDNDADGEPCPSSRLVTRLASFHPPFHPPSFTCLAPDVWSADEGTLPDIVRHVPATPWPHGIGRPLKNARKRRCVRGARCWALGRQRNNSSCFL
jgi:TATA-binding protein-associated factor Taf7